MRVRSAAGRGGPSISRVGGDTGSLSPPSVYAGPLQGPQKGEGGGRRGREASGLLPSLPPFSTTGRPQGKYCREVTRRREETEGGGEGGRREGEREEARDRPTSSIVNFTLTVHSIAPNLQLFMFLSSRLLCSCNAHYIISIPIFIPDLPSPVPQSIVYSI